MRSLKQSYSKEIYTKNSLLSAIKAYEKIAEIKLSDDNGYYWCEFNRCIVDPSRVVLEFGNYLIELLNNRENKVMV